MDISSVVEEKSHGGRESIGFGVSLDSIGHNLLILVGRHVVVFLVDPVGDGANGLSNVVSIRNEFWVVCLSASIIKIWLVDKVPG